ncbi:MAG: hypothetical protein GF334_08025, partial [Candidatus Altiarchaeales archaeon]|nr:hypothetical protein [Candidatus Altiarchaeales archaeon]
MDQGYSEERWIGGRRFRKLYDGRLVEVLGDGSIKEEYSVKGDLVHGWGAEFQDLEEKYSPSTSYLEEKTIGERKFRKRGDGSVVEVRSDGTTREEFELGGRKFQNTTSSLTDLEKAYDKAHPKKSLDEIVSNIIERSSKYCTQKGGFGRGGNLSGGVGLGGGHQLGKGSNLSRGAQLESNKNLLDYSLKKRGGERSFRKHQDKLREVFDKYKG